MINIKNKDIKKFLHYLISLRFIKLFSYWSARGLINKLNQSHAHKYAYYYGFQIIYGAINKFILLIIIGLLFHALPQILIVTISFMILRIYIGGLHFDSYTKCTYVSLFCLVLMGLLSKYISYHFLINLFVFSTIFIIALIYAPVEHKNRPLNNIQKIKFKYIALVLICIIYSVQFVIKDTNISNSIMYGVLLAGIIALPIFNKSIKCR